MRRLVFLIFLSIPITVLQAQYKNDNVKYQTVFLEDLCTALKNNPEYLLLDVRSEGEYHDTSSFANYNIGHLKNAINININDLDKKIGEIKNATDKPVFVYCSHSQRSRRASALLADSGFTKVYNINGGLSVFNLMRETGITCADEFYESGNKFKFLSPVDLIALLRKDKNILLIDIRKDSVFHGITWDEKLNASGKLNGAVNIPYNELKNSLQKIPKGKKIILVDESGTESPKAADFLSNNGYENIFVLYNGMDSWNSTPLSELSYKNTFWKSPANYKMITADDFDLMVQKTKNVVIVDTRSADEFNNKAKDSWRNRGNIKNAISIPFSEFESKWKELKDQKDKPVIIYNFSSQPESFKAARILSDNGFSKVYVLVGGIWNLRWRAANIKGKTHLDNWVENIPEENL